MLVWSVSCCKTGGGEDVQAFIFGFFSSVGILYRIKKGSELENFDGVLYWVECL